MPNPNLFANQMPMQQPMMPPDALPPWWVNPWLGHAMNNAGMGQNGPQNQNQQQSTRQKQASLIGRVVNSPNDITPDDIPTNGMPAIFPMADGSGIMVKALGNDFKVQDAIYVLQQPAPVEQKPSEFEMLMQRLTQIESAIASMAQQPTQKVKFEQSNDQHSKSGKKKEEYNNVNDSATD